MIIEQENRIKIQNSMMIEEENQKSKDLCLRQEVKNQK